MALLIDPPAWGAHGRLWSHLISDTSLAELHYFAGALGIPRRAFEGDHYDIPEERYAAVLASAWPVTELVDQPWDLTDFRVQDPDGYYLRVASTRPA